jgi:HK97 family phage prohead protease
MKLHPKVLEYRDKYARTPFLRYVDVPQAEEQRKANTESTDRILKTYHCMFGQVDDRGTRFMKGAFSRSIQERGPKSNAKYKITVLWMHDTRDPIGMPTVIEERDAGLYAEWEADDVPNGDRALKQIRSGTLNNFSFGFKPIWDKMEYNSQDDCIEVMEAELLELSPVTMGSNMNTYAVRGANNESDDDLIEDTEDFIRSVSRKQQLELRQLIDRHRLDALVPQQPLTTKAGSIDYNYLRKNLKLLK